MHMYELAKLNMYSTPVFATSTQPESSSYQKYVLNTCHATGIPHLYHSADNF